MATLQLRELARARAGDKGNISIITVVARDRDAYEWLREHLTSDAVAQIYGSLCQGPVKRYEVPGLKAFNFVLEQALSGGVTRSTRLDRHGKSLASLLLSTEVDVPSSLEILKRRYR